MRAAVELKISGTTLEIGRSEAKFREQFWPGRLGAAEPRIDDDGTGAAQRVQLNSVISGLLPVVRTDLQSASPICVAQMRLMASGDI